MTSDAGARRGPHAGRTAAPGGQTIFELAILDGAWIVNAAGGGWVLSLCCSLAAASGSLIAAIDGGRFDTDGDARATREAEASPRYTYSLMS